MASGHIHNLVTSIVSGAILAGGVVSHSYPLAAAACGVACGLLLSPDLDVRHGSVNNSNFRQIAPALARPWRALWWLYARLIPCHRHWLSHAPLIGTTARLLYLSPWLLFPYLLFNFPPGWVWPYLLWAAVGLALSDTLHWLMDGMPLYR